jgi:hypothetical protein
MDPNPKLIDRITNRHIGKGLRRRNCRYLPYLISTKIAEGIEPGDFVHVISEPEGAKPKKGSTDTRMVWIARGEYHMYNDDIQPKDNETYRVFLRDLSPI